MSTGTRGPRRRVAATPTAFLLAAVLLLAAGCGATESDSTAETAPATGAATTGAPATSAPARPATTTTMAETVTTVAESGGAACLDDPPPPPDHLEVTVDGTAREASVRVPAAAVGPMPVVLSFHGVNGTAAIQQATDGFSALADEEGFVLVHPQGLEVGLNDRVRDITGWDPTGTEVDEAAFVAALLDELATTVCIDADRVWAAGFSAGAHLAMVMACQLPDRIAAVAAVGAAYQPGGCASDRPTPTVAFHGLDDIVTPFDGRRTDEAGTFVPVLDALGDQARRNGCTGGPDTEHLTATVASLAWKGCDAPTVLYRLEDHGHAWPGHPMGFDEQLLVDVLAGAAGQPPDPLTIAIGETPESMARNVLLTNVDIDATEVIWDFFTTYG
jgi:polyhydroxybutyrate depolymerase